MVSRFPRKNVITHVITYVITCYNIGMTTESKNFFALYLRNFIFGVEDSLVSTVGLLSGIATAGVSANTIFLTGVILVFVEAFSMAAGSFLSERSAEEYVTHRGMPTRSFVLGGIIMFFSYFLSGFIPILPYVLLPINVAFWTSIALALVALFVLGVVSARAFNVNIVRSGFRMLLIGGIAVLLGAGVGSFLNM